MRKIISLICFLLPAMAFGGQAETRPEIRSDAPDQHIVVKGDTLWDISGKFFKDPWKWPYIWGMNKDSIKDPHWIYPGDVIVLDRASGTLSKGGNAKSAGDVVRLSPKTRVESSSQDAIASIPSDVIEPFLSQPLVVEDKQLAAAPTLIGLREERVIAGIGDVAYVKGLDQSQGDKWQVYHPGKSLIDPDTREVLGHEAIYLGEASVKEFGDVSTTVITASKMEIATGDRLVAAVPAVARNYLPRSPDTAIAAKIISIYGGVSLAGPNTVVTLNKGTRDGLQNGHVLALFRNNNTVRSEGKNIALPEERFGLVFVFRVFDKVCYALVMQSSLPAKVLDRAQTP